MNIVEGFTLVKGVRTLYAERIQRRRVRLAEAQLSLRFMGELLARHTDVAKAAANRLTSRASPAALARWEKEERLRAFAEKAYLATASELKKLSKESRAEYSLRRVVRATQEADRKLRAEIRAIKRAQKTWLDNKFWPMHRLNMVDADVAEKADEEPEIFTPAKSTLETRRKRQVRKAAARAAKVAAILASNPHAGKTACTPRQKIVWEELVEMAGWQWDKYAHTLVIRPGKDCFTVREEQFRELFPKVEKVVRDLKENVEAKAPEPAEPVFRPQMQFIGDWSHLFEDDDPQMESTAEGVANSDVRITEESGTIQLDTAESSTGAMLPTPPSAQAELCGPCTKPDHDPLSSRMFCFKTDQWLSTHKQGDTLMDLLLPSYVIETHGDQPNFALFNHHRYWRGDMEIEIKVNSNVRQFGQLLATFWYSLDCDLSRKVRENVWSASQNMHCLITANTSNVGKLVIPYKYVKPYLDLRRENISKKTLSKAKLGSFQLYVLVPLTVAASGAQSCSVSCFIRFTNVCFMGTVHRNVLQPQMFTAMMAAQMMQKMLGDNNRDRLVDPPNPVHIKPVTNTNWAVGTGQNLHSAPLRLNPSGVLPYTGGRALAVDEMQIPFVVGVFGLFKQIDWNAQQQGGACLWTMEASPILPQDQYPSTAVKDRKFFYLPPVAVISSLFRMWRGDMELRFDVVGPTEITGRLMVAFVPHPKIQPYENCMGSEAAYIDVQENRSFVFRIPYESDRAWRLKRFRMGYTGEFEEIMGHVHVFVVNPLIANTTIPDKCVINVYIRGASSFEVAVPTQPIIYLPWDPNMNTGNEGHSFHFKDGYFPVYSGTWRSFVTPDTAVLRYGATTDHIAQLSEEAKTFVLMRKAGVSSGRYGYFVIKDSDKLDTGDNLLCYFYLDGKPAQINCRYVVPWTNDETNYMYGIPTNSPKWAEAISSCIALEGWGSARLAKYLWKVEKSSNEFKVKGTGDLTLEWVNYTVVLPEMDERFDAQNVLGTQRVVGPTGYGKTTHGESFSDLKDLIRRTELYMERTPGFSTPENVASILLPISPVGLALDLGPSSNPNVVSNFARHSMMQIVSSGYRFYAGSMNLSVRCSSVGGPTGFWMQHRPYLTDRDRVATFYVDGILGTLVDVKAICQRGLATFSHDEANSSVAEITVPYYLDSECAFLQRSFGLDHEIRDYHTLGHLAIGALPGSEKPGAVRAYTAWASGGDDLRFMAFQGFPPMCFTLDPEPFFAQGHPIVVKMSRRFRRVLPGESIPPSIADSNDFEEIEPQMRIPILSDLMEAGSSFKNAGERVDRFTAQLADIDPTAVVETTLKEVKETAEYSGYFSFMYNAVSNIVHCILSPCWQSVVWAFTSIFQYIFNVTGMAVAKFSGVLEKIFAVVMKPFRKQAEEQGIISEDLPTTGVEPQMDDDCEVDDIITDIEVIPEKSFLRKHCASLLTVMITAIMSYLGYNAWKGEYNNKFVDLLFKLVRAFTSTANGLLTFFRGTIDMLQDLFDWCLAYVYPSWDSISFLSRHDADLFKWARQVQWLVDGRNRTSVLTNPARVAQLYSAANEACLIQQKLLTMDKKLDGPQLMILNQLTKDVMKLRDFASGMHIAPPCKFEPFVFQLAGPPKVGKSFIMQDLPVDMLDNVGYRTFCEPIYVRAPGNEYWNGLTNQPIVVYDDFLAILEPTFSSPQLSELFQLKTNCVFNPPMAAVDDKNIRYNPIIVGICSNACFWNLTGVLDPKAIHRRRDCLVEVELKPEYESIEKVPAEVLRAFNHLNYFMYTDPSDTRSPKVQLENYQDFRDNVMATFNRYYAEETRKYKERSASLFRLTPKASDAEFKFANHSVGESLDRYYQRKAEKADPDTVALKTLSVMIAGQPRHKRKAIWKEFLNQVAPTRDGTDEKVPFSIVGREDHILPCLEEAYVKIMELGKTREEFHTQIWKTIAGLNKKNTKEAGTHFILENIRPEMDEGNVPGPSKPKDEESPTVRPKGKRKDTERAKMRKMAEDFELGSVPQCTHELVLASNLVNSTLLYDNKLKAWTVDECDFKRSVKLCAHYLQEFAQYHPADLPPTKRGEHEDSDRWVFSHKPCGYKQCPFGKRSVRDLFVHKYMDSDATIKHLYDTEDPELKHTVPEEFAQRPVQVKVEAKEEQTWIQWFRSLKDKVMNASWGTVFKVLGWLSGAIGLILGFIKIGKWAAEKSKPKDTPTPEEDGDLLVAQGKMSDAEYEAWKQAQTKKRVTQRRALLKGKLERGKYHNLNKRYRANMNLDPIINPSVDQGVTSFVKRNTFFIIVNDAEAPDKAIVARCLGVCERSALFPTHYHDVWNRVYVYSQREPGRYSFEIRDSACPTSIPLNYEELGVFADPQSAIGILRMPPKFRMFRDIRSHFVTDEENLPLRIMATLYEYQFDANKDEFTMVKTRTMAAQRGATYVQSTKNFGAFTVALGYGYGYGGPGVCGSVLVCPRGRILGMHVAGADGGVGIAETIHPKDIEYASENEGLQAEIEIPEDLMFPVEDMEGYTPKVETGISYLGVTPDHLRNRAVPFSSLRPSAMTRDLVEAGFLRETEPAVLSSKDERIAHCPFDPLKEGIKHHGDLMKDFPLDVVEEASEDYSDFILARAEPVVDPVIISEEDAIMGIPGLPYVDSLDLGSSAGWPWRTYDRKNACHKNAWIDVDYTKEPHVLRGLDPALRTSLDIKMEQRLAGLVPITVFADVLKDETLKREKATRPGGTRVVSMSPLDFTIQQRMYTLPFVGSFMRHRLDLEHAIGINANSREWTDLFARLVGNGRTLFIAADYSKFGDKLPPRLGKFCFEIITRWYEHHNSPDSQEIRKVLLVMAEEVFSAKHIVGNTIYQTHSGMPSGNTMTVIFNTMVNSMFMRIAWIMLTRGSKLAGLDLFRKLVTVYSYGDDLLVSVDEIAADIFNTTTISELFAQFNLKFTDADKEGIMRPFRSIDELVFLKRGWKQIPKSVKLESLKTILLAPLDKATVEQVPFWCNKSMADAQGAVFLMDEALRLAFSHGPEYYTDLKRRYAKIARNYGLMLSAPSWHSLCDRTYVQGLHLAIGHAGEIMELEPGVWL